MRRSLAAFASLGVLLALLVLVGVGVTACTAPAAPTPNVEELAKALANVWATQTAVAAPAAGSTTAASALPTGTAVAQVAPTELAPAAVSPAPATEAPATQAPLPSATLMASPTAPATPTAANTPEPTRTLQPTSTPRPFNTFTPGPTSAVACPIAVNPELAGGWNRATLGCPVEDAAVVWAAWQPFQRGMMLWRSDKDQTYALLFANGDLTRGSIAEGGDAWRWDNTFPNGRGLTPPTGFFEPVRGFGYVWSDYLGAAEGPLGWATQPEQGICVTRQ
ncbi:MAG: hypothetical protein ACM30E_01580, partial [Nitrososphaerales archaeon]